MQLHRYQELRSRELQAVGECAHYRTFTAAAKALGVSPAVGGRKIQALEREHGDRPRTARAVDLPHSGQARGHGRTEGGFRTDRTGLCTEFRTWSLKRRFGRGITFLRFVLRG
ncbi:MAG: LysR family transcriptional regulator [Isosphaeraceae bacterium]